MAVEVEHGPGGADLTIGELLLSRTLVASMTYESCCRTDPWALATPVLSVEQSVWLSHDCSPKIILASSGMATGGCIVRAQGAGAFPRLAGQHQSYLLRQIEVFKNGSHGNAPVMSVVAHQLSTEQAQAVAAYLQSK